MTQEQIEIIIASGKHINDLYASMMQVIEKQQELAKKQEGKDNEDYHDGKFVGMVVIKQLFMDEFGIK